MVQQAAAEQSTTANEDHVPELHAEVQGRDADVPFSRDGGNEELVLVIQHASSLEGRAQPWKTGLGALVCNPFCLVQYGTQLGRGKTVRAPAHPARPVPAPALAGAHYSRTRTRSPHGAGADRAGAQLEEPGFARPVPPAPPPAGCLPLHCVPRPSPYRLRVFGGGQGEYGVALISLYSEEARAPPRSRDSPPPSLPFPLPCPLLAPRRPAPLRMPLPCLLAERSGLISLLRTVHTSSARVPQRRREADSSYRLPVTTRVSQDNGMGTLIGRAELDIGAALATELATTAASGVDR